MKEMRGKMSADKDNLDGIAFEKAEAMREAALARAAAALSAAEAAAVPKKGVVVVGSLHIRKDHGIAAEHIGGLVMGNRVTIFETWTDGKDTWAKIGPDQWVAMIYNGETYVKVE
jgi:hypothetical protein